MSESGLADRQRKLRKTWFIVCAVVVAIVLLVSLVMVKPSMPKRVVFLTGAEGSAYHELGKQYADELRRSGLDAEVIVTKGALDNVRLLAEQSNNTVAFAPSTVDWSEVAANSAILVTLGSVGFEPLWLFCRSDLEIAGVRDLRDRTVATEGSGTVSDFAARALIDKNGLTGEIAVQPHAGLTSHVLLDGFATKTIDAGFVTGEVDSPIVQSMLMSERAKFLSFNRAEAYAGLVPGLNALVAPEGIFDLQRNVPPRDALLLAATTCLVAHKNLHGAVVPRILVAAEKVRSQKAVTTFVTSITFPSDQHVTLPIDSAARRYFHLGETGWSKHLPYKVSRVLSHIGFFVLPLLAAVAVLLKLTTTGLRVWGGMRLKQFFKQLVAVEKRHAAGEDLSKLRVEIDRIDQASATIFVPMSTLHDYIDFRQFLHDMRERLYGEDRTG